ncbi:MAG: ABC transporter ATP-binding protein, partial [Christensenellales bacterium]|nr:ABC transporter ATP-binding protein [Christensenellales bacterium]
MQEEKVLEVKNLKTYFYTDEGVIPAVDGVDFSLERGETLAIVGESGCGKSVTSLSILRLIANPPGRIIGGEILYNGKNLLSLTEKEMRSVRGNDISMIFQEPMTSLNPVFPVGKQIMESLTFHQHMTKEQARERAIEMLRLVEIPNPEKCIHNYPHQLSGGMRQRVMIAMALACNPKILIADEPTTALDVTIQAQILKLMAGLQEKTQTSIILITHDLGIVAQIARNVMVMYAGEEVEYADVRTIFKDPRHPYTIGLLKSIPSINE